jgi:hypothetical protein
LRRAAASIERRNRALRAEKRRNGCISLKAQHIRDRRARNPRRGKKGKEKDHGQGAKAADQGGKKAQDGGEERSEEAGEPLEGVRLRGAPAPLAFIVFRVPKRGRGRGPAYGSRHPSTGGP